MQLRTLGMLGSVGTGRWEGETVTAFMHFSFPLTLVKIVHTVVLE